MDYNNPNTPPQNFNNPNPQNPQNLMDDVTRGKTIAILSYCLPIGWIIAIIMHQSDKTKFGAYHIRQSLGLFIFAVGAIVVISILGWVLWFLWFLVPFIQLTLLAFVIIGIVNAAGGKTKGLPLIGSVSEKMLAGIQ